MSIFDKFKTQTETINLNPEDNYLKNITEINQELNNISVRALMTGGKLSWHDVRKYVNSNFRADEICKKANDQGVPIVYQGKTYENWETI